MNTSPVKHLDLRDAAVPIDVLEGAIEAMAAVRKLVRLAVTPEEIKAFSRSAFAEGQLGAYLTIARGEA